MAILTRDNANNHKSGTRRSNRRNGTSDTLTRGVTAQEDPSSPAEPPLVSHCLDWLTYTVPREVGLERAFLQHPALAITGEILPNIKGYDRHIAMTYGSISFHTRHPEHKICVLFRGKDLREARAAGVNVDHILADALAKQATITRLDFAVDYHGPSSPLELNEAVEMGLVKVPTRHHEYRYSCDRVKGEARKAHTVYLGSQSSERRLRCYDKAAQLKVSGPWTRIELVVQKGYGNRLAKAMVQEGIGAAGKQALREFIQCNLGWFNHALNGPSLYIEAAERSERDVKRWLLTQVLPTFAREVARGAVNGDFEVRDAFRQAITNPWDYRDIA
jgi:hypothetical protein